MSLPDVRCMKGQAQILEISLIPLRQWCLSPEPQKSPGISPGVIYLLRNLAPRCTRCLSPCQCTHFFSARQQPRQKDREHPPLPGGCSVSQTHFTSTVAMPTGYATRYTFLGCVARNEKKIDKHGMALFVELRSSFQRVERPV